MKLSSKGETVVPDTSPSLNADLTRAVPHHSGDPAGLEWCGSSPATPPTHVNRGSATERWSGGRLVSANATNASEQQR
jgi:hypothetical protein